MKKENLILIYLKGFLMGICDLIPGISGGTIAFITGIYKQLIGAISSILSLKTLKIFSLKNKLKKELVLSFDLVFLISLGLGILSAIILGAKLIEFLLSNYTNILFAFFIGLILASSKIVYRKIKIHTLMNLLFGLTGLLLGVLLLSFSPKEITNPSFLYVFFGGFLAISALFLPGISGSSILVILGLYEYIISIVSNITQKYLSLIPFILGAFLGTTIISKIITYLFEKDASKTLYLLLGLLIGSLSIPFLKVIRTTKEFNLVTSTELGIFFLLGIVIILVFEKFTFSSKHY